jgi:hypothetical protein
LIVCLLLDAFSKFDQWEPNREEHKRDIKEATKYLLEKEIPMFIPTLLRIFHEETEPNEIIQLMHRTGINLRSVLFSFDFLCRE